MISAAQTVDIWFVKGLKFLSEGEALSAARRGVENSGHPIQVTKAALPVDGTTLSATVYPHSSRIDLTKSRKISDGSR